MLGRVIAGVLSTFLLAVSASGQCDYRVQFSGEYRASIFDIAIDNNDLWTASGYGVQLYDRSVDSPRLIATAGVPGVTRVVRASNGIAYAGGTSGISVVRRAGNSLQLVRTVSTGVVSDLLMIAGTLFAATPTGIVEFDLLNRENPNLTGATFATSKPSVTSLALIGSTLYAADGDSSIEVFSIAVPSSPQKTGTLTSSLARASKVEAIGTRLYVSDGISTEVFAPSGSSLTSLGTIPYAMAAIADGGSNVIFVAGNDRQLHALDVLVPQNYVELFDDELAPTAGTVNRITALQIAGGRLYVGGGDSGLATYDISGFSTPFPLRAYAIGATNSIVIAPDAVYAGRSDTGIQTMSRSASGSLVVQKTFSNGNNETVQDTSNGFLLSSTGTTLEFWTVKADPPQLVTSSTFRAPILNAFFSNLTAIVLLTDGTLWTADLTQLNPAPVRVASTFSSLVQLAHSTHATAATEISADGTTTTLHFWSGDLNATPVDTTIPGASTALAV
ncbi:MAG TPA: hypothetical protein VF505_14945, partial [Thermoanaerobaculia bacterium]